jgi:hypothetical protein
MNATSAPPMIVGYLLAQVAPISLNDTDLGAAIGCPAAAVADALGALELLGIVTVLPIDTSRRLVSLSADFIDGVAVTA